MYALLEAGFDPLPLTNRDHARHQVEGEDLLDAAVVLIHGERDAMIAEAALAQVVAAGPLATGEGGDRRVQATVVGAWGIRSGEHLVVVAANGVAVEQ